MKRFERDLRNIAEYCKTNILEFEERLSFALQKIEYLRAPLQQVDISLYNDIEDAIDDYASDYDIDSDNICAEDVIWL
jgi:hypothetical protein